MDMQRAATNRSLNRDHGRYGRSATEGASGLDQRDMWRMGKAQELRVRSIKRVVIVAAGLIKDSGILVPGRPLDSPPSSDAPGSMSS